MKIFNFLKSKISKNNDSRKYELTSETKEVDGHILHRIKYLQDVNHIKAGSYGGWLECEDNLSQVDDCLVLDDAMVYGSARVSKKARVGHAAKVYGSAYIGGKAMISESACISGRAYIYDEAAISGEAKISDNATISGSVNIGDNVEVSGRATISGYTIICGNVRISGDAFIIDADFEDDVVVDGEVEIKENVLIKGDAVIKNNEDFLIFKNNWSSGRYFVWTRSNDKWAVGCFYGTGEQLIQKAYEDSEDKGKHYEATVQYAKTLEELNKLPNRER